jgi:hypothetical protein
MDIFFMITTFVVVILGILVGMVLYKLWRILGHVERFSQMMNDETQLIRADIAQLRGNVHEGGLKMRYFMQFFKGTFGELFRSGRKRVRKHESKIDQGE